MKTVFLLLIWGTSGYKYPFVTVFKTQALCEATRNDGVTKYGWDASTCMEEMVRE